MIPVKCRIGHSPAEGKFGDCVRACVASIMEMDAEAVPHFHHDNCDGEIAFQRIRDWLAPLGYQPFIALYPGSITRPEFMDMMRQLNPNVHYILYGSVGENCDHVVVCRGGTVVNNPGWVNMPMIGPHSSGHWGVMVIAKV